MRTVERLALCAIVAGALGGCGGSEYQNPRERHGTIDTGGQIFGPKRKWEEGPVTLPAYPEQANFLRFDIFGPSRSTYYLDTRSISIGTDGVARYTLLARSQEGVENVTYEGIHCEERRWRPYAYGRGDRTWLPARDAQWQAVARQKVDDFRFTLYRTYFCPDGYPRRAPEEVIAEIRRQYQAGPLDERR